MIEELKNAKGGEFGFGEAKALLDFHEACWSKGNIMSAFEREIIE